MSVATHAASRIGVPHNSRPPIRPHQATGPLSTTHAGARIGVVDLTAITSDQTPNIHKIPSHAAAGTAVAHGPIILSDQTANVPLATDVHVLRTQFTDLATLGEHPKQSDLCKEIKVDTQVSNFMTVAIKFSRQVRNVEVRVIA